MSQRRLIPKVFTECWLFGGLFLSRQDVSHPSPCPPEAVAGGAGGQRPIPGAGVDRPGGYALQDPMETRHTAHTSARGRGHHFQGNCSTCGSTNTLRRVTCLPSVKTHRQGSCCRHRQVGLLGFVESTVEFMQSLIITIHREQRRKCIFNIFFKLTCHLLAREGLRQI